MEIWQRDALSLAQAYQDHRLTPDIVVDALLARIERLNPLINAFVAIAPDCREQAAESAKRLQSGSARSPLEGIPIAVKDSLCVAGMAASWGSHVFSDTVCDADELPIRRLRDAGAILIGKTNTPEFAVEGFTANALFGVTGNPWNPELTPGGSSGGPVAAVAAGLVPVAIGTDGGGSIRRPAAYTGLYGLKPTIGRVPRDGGLPQLLLDFEVAGPLARSPRDCRLVHSVLASPDRADPRSRRFAGEQAGSSADGLRILYVERFADAPCDPAILASCGRAADDLAALGHNVAHGDLPFDLGAFNRFWSNIAQIGLARLVRENPAMTRAGKAYLAMAEKGATVAAVDFAAGLGAIDRLRRDVSLAFQHVDLIMMPSCAAMPWPADQAWPETIDGQPVGPRGHAVYTGWVNGAGHPAIAIPAEPSDNGMPVGFQLIGDLGSETLLLEVAEAFEAHNGGWRRWPDLFS
jgi:aspartyl-tRNA(Asn)/glutamyl-tRNA(Gln) amidotransferase subunit A